MLCVASEWQGDTLCVWLVYFSRCDFASIMVMAMIPTLVLRLWIAVVQESRMIGRGSRKDVEELC